MRLRVLILLFVALSAVRAQAPFSYRPGIQYDPAIPSEAAVLGYEPGSRISSPAEILTYLRALQKAAPDRMRLVTYGHTWEGRELVYAVLGSPANLARLETIQAEARQVADPRKTTGAEAKRLSANLPAIVWLAYGVHGNEISSPDAALVTAYHVLAARNDAAMESVRRDVLLIIDPLQNPDGRNRFVQNFESARGPEPDSSQLAAEHNEPWPSGRTNHYAFDLNRDWFALTQIETQGRVAAVREWLPLVFVDLHEMGSDSTYFFTPEADPFNPFITPSQKKSLEWFGRKNAGYFDRFGLSYFTREGYDEFYPGYGASWPLYYGGIGMTYEQASTRGLVVKRSDGATVEYRESVGRHFLTSLSSLEVAAEHRQDLWDNFYQYRAEAVAEGRNGKLREYLLLREGNTTAADRLAARLADQGIEVRRAATAFTNSGRHYPAGTYSILLAQPQYRLIRTLLDAQVSMREGFLNDEERRRRARQPSEMYDVTAWSLPLQDGVTAVSAESVSEGGEFVSLPAHYQPESKVSGNGSVAYLVPWGTSGAGAFLGEALRSGLRVDSSDRSFVQAGRRFPAGTLIVHAKEDAVKRAATASGAEVVGTDSSWMEEGPNFGSRFVHPIPHDLHIALAWDRPTAPSSAGAARFLLEREFHYPVTVVRLQQLSSADLSQFQVLLLPDATSGEAYDAAFGTAGVRRLREWLSNGGTLVALGPGAVSFLGMGNAGLLHVAQENAAHPGDKSAADKSARERDGASEGGSSSRDSARVPGTLMRSAQDFEKATQPDAELPDSLHGVLLRAVVDRDHWMSAGAPATVTAMVTGRYIFTPLKQNQGANVSYFEGPDQIIASGFAWDLNRQQLAYKPFVLQERSGRGNIIAFTADPAFRGYMDGLHVLLLNAIFRGPAHLGAAGAAEGEE